MLALYVETKVVSSMFEVNLLVLSIYYYSDILLMTISKGGRCLLLKKRLREACYDVTMPAEHLTNRSEVGIKKSK